MSNTVADALQAATRYWEANERTNSRGPNMMPIRARVCADLLGRSRKLSSLTAADGMKLLIALRQEGRARSTIASYYAAGRRMLSLSGVSTHDWPKAPTPGRTVREPVKDGLIADTLINLKRSGHEDTARLVELMRDTGLRIDSEALRGDFTVSEDGRLTVRAGKGGHDRVIPYRGPETGRIKGVTYETHLRRIKEASGGRLLPHDLRRAFVTRAYHKSGKDIRVAQALAGHSDPGTTAGYIGVGWDQMEGAVL